LLAVFYHSGSGSMLRMMGGSPNSDHDHDHDGAPEHDGVPEHDHPSQKRGEARS
jgi:hypothetical protein